MAPPRGPGGDDGPPQPPEDDGPDSFKAFACNWRDVIWDAARSILWCDADADDVTQDVLLDLFKDERWREVESPEKYCHNAGIKEALQFLRRRRPLPLTDEIAAVVPDQHMLPDEEASRSERAAALRRGIGRLPDRCGLVVLLHLRGFTQTEIAELLGVEVAAVQKQMARARRLLKPILGPVLGLSDDVSSSGDGGKRAVDASYGVKPAWNSTSGRCDHCDSDGREDGPPTRATLQTRGCR